MNAPIFQQIPLFATLPAQEVERLGQRGQITTTPAGAILFQEGQSADQFSILLEGHLEIVKAIGTADERLLATLGPGDFLGEMSLLNPEKVRSASARTLTEVRLLEIPMREVEALLSRQPAFALAILRDLGGRLNRSENDTIRDLRSINRQLAQAYQELQAAQAQLVEKEKLEHELRLARRIQEGLLPKEIPQLPNWKLAAYWQPAREVSGDFYHFIPYPDGQIALVIGDVSGKGMPAALVMAITRSVLNSVAQLGHSPGKMLAQVNDILCADMPANMFVTCLHILLQPASGQLQIANAGHSLPLRKSAREVLELRARGMPLGLLPDMSYEEIGCVMEPGDSLFIYSDGLIEAHNNAREMFGVGRLKDFLSGYRRDRPIVASVLARLEAFTGSLDEPEDDITIVTLERG